MKIAAVLHKVRPNLVKGYEELRRKVANATEFDPDMIIGPDYGINVMTNQVSSKEFYGARVLEYMNISGEKLNNDNI